MPGRLAALGLPHQQLPRQPLTGTNICKRFICTSMQVEQAQHKTTATGLQAADLDPLADLLEAWVLVQLRLQRRGCTDTYTGIQVDR